MKTYYFICHSRDAETGLLRYAVSAINHDAAINSCKIFLQENIKRFFSIDICYRENRTVLFLQQVQGAAYENN